jgi:hypothetical protein
MDMQAMVRAFHEKHGQPVSDSPVLTTHEAQEFRVSLMREELKEYEDAAAAGDLVGMYDALLDLLYVTIGSCVSHGFPVDAGFAEVHASNMTKDAIKVHGATSKVSKGPNFRPPNLLAVLAVEDTRIVCTCMVDTHCLNDPNCPVLKVEGLDHNPGAFVVTLPNGWRMLTEPFGDGQTRTLSRLPRGE